MAKSDVWVCWVAEEDKARRLPPSQQRISIIAGNLEEAREQAANALQKCDPDDTPAVPTIRLEPGDIQCMPQEEWQRSYP